MSHDASGRHATNARPDEIHATGRRALIVAVVIALVVGGAGAIAYIVGVGPFGASDDAGTGTGPTSLVASSSCPWTFTLPDLFAEPTQAVGPAPGDPGPWSVHAMDRRGQDGQCFEYTCPPNGTAFPIWGTLVYTDDSSICTAAVHAGAITLGQGGTVRILIRPGQNAYPASSRGGIASDAWGIWEGSFVIAGP
jgi:hypothetical protein